MSALINHCHSESRPRGKESLTFSEDIERCLQTFVPQQPDYGSAGDFARHDK